MRTMGRRQQVCNRHHLDHHHHHPHTRNSSVTVRHGCYYGILTATFLSVSALTSGYVSTIPYVRTTTSTTTFSPRRGRQLRDYAASHDTYLPRNDTLSFRRDDDNDATPPSSDDDSQQQRRRRRTARITLVGSGPGDPDLLTLAAHRVLSDPDAFVVADRLVSPEILALIAGETKVARKLPGCAEKAQEEIYEWCEEAVRSNEYSNVVRLKIGDPFVFGRGGEEVLRFRETFSKKDDDDDDEIDVDIDVVPGVSAAFAAPLLGGVPVTHRGVSNQVVMCTGYGRNGTSPDLIRYHPEQTVVFLMAVGRLEGLCDSLIEKAGYPADTPVAVVENAGCPSQRTLVGDMTDVAGLARKHEIRPPSTIVVGEVVRVLLETTEQREGEDEDGSTERILKHGLVDDAKRAARVLNDL